MFKFLPDKYRGVKWSPWIFTDEVMLNKKMSSPAISSMTADGSEAENTIYLGFICVWKSKGSGMPFALLPLSSFVKLIFLFLEIVSAQMSITSFTRDFWKVTR